MTDHWDTMIEKDDAELVAEISADKAAYTFHMCAGNVAACIDIEKKYGLLGLSPQQVSEQLAQFRKKPVDQLIRILAGLAASALDMGGHVQHMLPLAEDRDEDRVLLEALDAKKLNAALRASFDAADYFAGVTAQACKEAIALCDPKQPITGKEKKSELAKLAADLVKKSNAGGKAGYLPPEMRTTHYDGPAPKAVGKVKAAKKKAR